MPLSSHGTYPTLSVLANTPQIGEMSSSATSLTETFRLGVYQFAPHLRDVAANISKVAAAAGSGAFDLLVTPELSLTGYDLRDDAHELARALPEGGRASAVWGEGLGGGRVLVGAIEQAESTVPHNIAALIDDDVLAFVHRKIYLPTYGMFDEGRYFGAGERVETFLIDGWRFGVLICEDMWHPMLSYLHALQGAHVLVIMAAAPGRGVWEGGEEGSFFASSDAWERIGRAYAQLYGTYVVICNRCGVEGGVTFAGESLIVAPNATVVARAGVDEELLHIELSASAIKAARRPYAHIRDEDGALGLRELQRIVGA